MGHLRRPTAPSLTCTTLFSHFIPCGVWEAVYIIDGLLKNKSEIQPDTIHADTQGQSLPVFALAQRNSGTERVGVQSRAP